jgi:hypothetical protein
MSRIHLLPTDKDSNLFIGDLSGQLHFNYSIEKGSSRNQHIHLTSEEEEIKDCWVLNTHTNQVYFLQGFYGRQPITKKIILTTDTDLIAEGVQALEDEFLEWFVKNPSCTEVEVEDYGNNFYNIRYLILIPQEEPKQTDEQGRVMTYWGGLAEPKQKTLEAAAKKYSGLAYDRNDYEEKYYNQIGCTKYDAFIDAVQWHQERSYSEEEVLELLRKAHFVEQNIEEWFEQFKKK